MSIFKIFESKGESYFRKIEKITLEELKNKKIVISLGGGAVTNSTIRKEINNSSISFWLDPELKSIIPRLKNTSKRPLLNNGNLEKTINKIYSARKKFYNESNFQLKQEI